VSAEVDEDEEDNRLLASAVSVSAPTRTQRGKRSGRTGNQRKAAAAQHGVPLN